MSFRLKSWDFMKYLCLNCSTYLYEVYIYEQHGFHPGRTTITRNMVFVNHIMDAFRRQDQEYVIHTDFQAFDQVNYAVLVKVLTAYSIGEPFLS